MFPGSFEEVVFDDDDDECIDMDLSSPHVLDNLNLSESSEKDHGHSLHRGKCKDCDVMLYMTNFSRH